MNATEKRIDKMIRKTIRNRATEGWDAETIGKRVWTCYGHLYGVRANILTVQMPSGEMEAFAIGIEAQLPRI